MTILRGLQFEAFGRFPKTVRNVQAQSFLRTLRTSDCPDQSWNGMEMIVGVGRQKGRS
jgi:hypothetical protein